MQISWGSKAYLVWKFSGDETRLESCALSAHKSKKRDCRCKQELTDVNCLILMESLMQVRHTLSQEVNDVKET